MSRIDRHIGTAVLLSMAVVIALTGILDRIFALLDEFPDISETYALTDALWYVLMTAPSSIYELLPFSALGGSLIGLGILASNNELIVIQAAGVSSIRIVFAVIKPTLLVMVLSLLLGEYISPPLEQLAQSNRAIQITGSQSISSELGNWQRIGREYVHINAIAPGGLELIGVSRFETDGNRHLVSASFAESASYVESPAGNYWLLENVEQSLFTPEAVLTNNYLQEDWSVDLSPELLTVMLVDPDEQSISGLYRLGQFFASEGLDSRIYYLAFWKKLLQPIATLALVLLAISFVFGPLRESTTGSRVFLAIGIGLGFTIVQRMMEPASLIFGFSPLLAVLMPILVCGGVGYYLLLKVQ
jgi:lipopolysaccharide export system permease protein